jgi:hypothetical protein
VLDRELELIGWLRRFANECIYACSLLEWSEQQPKSFLQENRSSGETDFDITADDAARLIIQIEMVKQWSTWQLAWAWGVFRTIVNLATCMCDLLFSLVRIVS